MTTQEKRPIVFLIIDIIAFTSYYIILLNTSDDKIQHIGELKFWAGSILLLIPIMIILRIVLYLIFSLLNFTITKEKEEKFLTDEFGEIIKLKSTRNFNTAFMLGFVITMANIVEHTSLFRLSIFSILLMNIISIVLGLYLYKLFTPIHKSLALFMLSFLFFGAGISMINEINHFAVLFINNSDAYNIEEAQRLTSLFIDLQKYGSHIAVIFWGLWLFPLAVLLSKLETRISNIIGITLVIAGLGYIFDSVIMFVKPSIINFTVSDFTFFGELLIILWFLFKSRTIEQLILDKIQN